MIRNIILGAIGLLSINLNAQNMNSAKDVVIQLFISTYQKAWDDVKETFSNEVLLDYSSMNGNPATRLSPKQIIEAWKGILPGFSHTHHQLGNFQIREEANSAFVFCYGTASHYLEDDGGNLWTVVGSYDFELKKEEGNWKISTMKFNFKYQSGNTNLPQKAIENSK